MNKKFARLSLTVLVVFVMALALVGTALAATDLHQDTPIYWDTFTQECKGDENLQSGEVLWHFVLTQTTTINSGELTATFTDGNNDTHTITQAYAKYVGSVLHWNIVTPQDWVLQGASTTADGDQLNLSHVCPAGPPPKLDITVSKTAIPSYTRTFDWTIDKSADKETVYSVGGGESGPVNFTVAVTKDAGTDSDFAVSGMITVSNPNDFGVNGVDVSDTTPGGTCTVDNSPLDVPADGSATTTYSCTFESNPGSGTNTVTATWEDFGSPHKFGTGTANYTFGDPTNVVNDAIDVTDTNGQSWHFTGTDSKTYEVKYTDPAGTCTSHENTATITGLNKSDSVTVKDCQGADLIVEKTAFPTYDRTFAWNITKDVDKTLIKQFGGSATFNYAVNVSHDDGTDSNFKVSGTITVSNPNDWEDIWWYQMADTLPSNSSGCDIWGSWYTNPIPAGGSTSFPWSCTFSSKPSGTLTNKIEVYWDAAAYHTPSGSASDTVEFAFGDPTNLIDESIDVSDSYAGTLGTVTVDDANPTTFTYSRTVPVPIWNCTSYDNTATFTANDTGATGSASQTVKVCGPMKTGALTMGFWQNKNGQDLIKNAGAASGVCKLTPFLRTYAPFQDLSATATCTQAATYVTNVIKAANASGASMNAMLKAQMLATSLDVYFYNIGGYSVDLTMICTDLTCKAFEDSSSVFGGTPKTISEMLAFAASQSNVGGSMWYGNLKSTQELAKDAFDAINNQKVFAP